MSNNLLIIKQLMSAQRNKTITMYFWMGMVIVAAGLVCLIAGLLSQSPDRNYGIGLGVFFLVGGLISAMAYYFENPGFQHLINSVDQGLPGVVAVYKEKRIPNNPGARAALANHLHFVYDNKKDLSIWMPEKTIDELLDLIHQEFPNINIKPTQESFI